MAGGPREHRRLNPELKQVLLLTRRSHTGTLIGELARQPIPYPGIQDVAGHPAQVEGVLVVLARERVQRIPAIPVQISLLGPTSSKFTSNKPARPGPCTVCIRWPLGGSVKVAGRIYQR